MFQVQIGKSKIRARSAIRNGNRVTEVAKSSRKWKKNVVTTSEFCKLQKKNLGTMKVELTLTLTNGVAKGSETIGKLFSRAPQSCC